MGSAEDSDYEYEYVLLELPELEETNFLRQTCKRLDIVVRTRAACPRPPPPRAPQPASPLTRPSPPLFLPTCMRRNNRGLTRSRRR